MPIIDWAKFRPGDEFRAADHVGELLIAVGPVRHEVSTTHGPAMVARCKRLVALGDDVTFDGRNVNVFGLILAPSLFRRNPGRDPLLSVCGVLATGPGRPGESPPYQLDELDETGAREIAARVEAWVATWAAKVLQP